MLDNPQFWRTQLDIYGTADSAPEHLRALLTSDNDRIAKALDYLCGAVVHQSTVSMVATPILEFLLDALKQGLITNPHARAATCEFLGYLGESLNGASHEDFGEINIDQKLLSQLASIEDPSDREEFLEAEGFELFEQTYPLPYKLCSEKKEEVITVLSTIDGADEAIKHWREV